MSTAFDRESRTGIQEPATRLEAQRFLRLVDQSTWANHQWVEFVYSLHDPEERPRELLAHIMLGERVWFDRIDGREGSGSTFPILTREELLRGFEENARTYRELIESRMDDVIHFRRATGVEYQARVDDIIQHLLTHGYHHRGQLAAHYARGGKPYPSTDHIDYLVEKRL